MLLYINEKNSNFRQDDDDEDDDEESIEGSSDGEGGEKKDIHCKNVRVWKEWNL